MKKVYFYSTTLCRALLCYGKSESVCLSVCPSVCLWHWCTLVIYFWFFNSYTNIKLLSAKNHRSATRQSSRHTRYHGV